ncbi:MAG: LPS export ABC transporter permease LptG [Thiothrix sp.]|jgi:lipopolysaccharide export system permease protein|nr:MAG: LPS export ABC transporter permease LptG [Thiothrix sp.]
MKLLTRYLWKNLLLNIFMTWLSLSLLFGLFDFLAELGDTKVGTRYGVLQALLYVVYSLPRTLYENFPYAALIGSLMGLGNLAANSEITAMRAAGFSIRQIVLTTLNLGLVLSLWVFVLGEWVVPRSEAYAESFKIRSLQQELSISDEGVWLKNAKQLIHIDKVWSKVKVEGLAIYEIDEQLGGISRILKAASAEKQGNDWLLKQVVDQYLSKTRVERVQYEQLKLPNVLPANILNLATVTPEQLAARELAQFIQHQRDNALNTDRFELEYWKHFTTPLSTLVMLVLAAPLVFGFQRNAGAGQRIFIGILIGISYLLLDRIIGRTGLVYGLPPLLSAILPMLLFSALGLFMLGRVR